MQSNNELPTVPGCVNGSCDFQAYWALQLTKPLFVPYSHVIVFWIYHNVPPWDRYVLNSWELLILNLLELESIPKKLHACFLCGSLMFLDGSCILMTLLPELSWSRISQVSYIYCRYISLFHWRKSLKAQRKKSRCHKYNMFLTQVSVRV